MVIIAVSLFGIAYSLLLVTYSMGRVAEIKTPKNPFPYLTGLVSATLLLLLFFTSVTVLIANL